MNPSMPNTPINYTQSPRQKILRKKLVLVLITLFAFGAFFWVSTHSYVDVIVQNQSSGGLITYNFLNQASGKSAVVISNSAHIKKMVARTNYEVLVEQNGKSYFSVVKTKGFLGHLTISAKLMPERARTFVGDGPAACMYYLNNMLISYSCGDTYGNINIHVPATATQPTYIAKNTNRSPPYSSTSDGYIEGFIKTSQGNIALIHSINGGQSFGGDHIIFNVADSLTSSGAVHLSKLDNNKTYAMVPYQGGFIVYDAALDSVWAYSSTNSNPIPINLDKPDSKGLHASVLDAQGNLVLAAYLGGADSNKQLAEAIVVDNNISKHYIFKKHYSAISFCGSQKLCAVGAKGLDVYDISGQKARLLFNVSGVSAIKNSAFGLLIARKQALLNLDVNSRSGFVDYSFGDFRYSGIQNSKNGYILSITNTNSKTSALYIDQTVVNSDSIDKKVAALQKFPGISALSVYKNYIYITPNLGQPVYDSATNSFNYDQATKQNVNNKISQEIKSLGINTSKYFVINTLE